MYLLGLAKDGLTGFQSRNRFREALRNRDIPLLMKASKVLFPASQQPKDEKDALAMMHITRTGADWLDLEARAYSHFWCEDNDVPSLLPRNLLLAAEGFRPTVQASVGIALGTAKDWLKPALGVMGHVMSKEVQNNVELIEGDPDLLRDKILFAKNDEFKRLFGVATAKEVEK